MHGSSGGLCYGRTKRMISAFRPAYKAFPGHTFNPIGGGVNFLFCDVEKTSCIHPEVTALNINSLHP